MELIKIVLMIGVTMALSITLTMGNDMEEWKDSDGGRVSRFLAAKAKKGHCRKDYAACYVHGSNATTCCNNKCVNLREDKNNCGKCKKKCINNHTCCRGKCVNLREDKNNCGGCKKKCIYTKKCCRGKCVNTTFDKRHCGSCGNKCKPGALCIYGMCDYSI